MTQEVLLTLKGLQFDQREEDSDQIETVVSVIIIKRMTDTMYSMRR